MWCQKLEENKFLFSLSKAQKHTTSGLLYLCVFTHHPLPLSILLVFEMLTIRCSFATCADLGIWRSANGLRSELLLYFTVRPLMKALPSVRNDLLRWPHRTTSPAAAVAVTLYFFSLLTPRLKLSSLLSLISASGNLPTIATSVTTRLSCFPQENHALYRTLPSQVTRALAQSAKMHNCVNWGSNCSYDLILQVSWNYFLTIDSVQLFL